MAKTKQTDNNVALTKIKNGSVIKLFDRTPPPKKKNDVFCPHFWEFKYANGCDYDCQWCYLNGTFRFKETGKKPYLKDMRMVKAHLKEGLEKIKPRTLFNAGEVSDALVFEGHLIAHGIPLFMDDRINATGHKLLVLTKSCKMRLLAYNCSRTVIMAYSVNAHWVSNNYELRAPHPRDRLGAARRMADGGHEIRLRIDPMVPVKRWDIGYKQLLEEIMELVPFTTVITIGSLRGLQSTLTTCKKLGLDTSWKDYLAEKTNWGLKIPQETRVEMYAFIKDTLDEFGWRGKLALCKETLEVWKELGMKPSDTKCNCML